MLTIISGARVRFGDAAAQRAAVDRVFFVLRFNFVAGFAYAIAAAGLWMRRRWAVWAALCIAVATMGVFTAFGVHVLDGGSFEWRTVGAMSLRSLFWAALAWVGYRCIWR